MTNQETNLANAAVTTLTSTVGPTDLTFTVDSTTDFPSVPFYVVLDPDDDTKREIAEVDSSTTSTTMVVSNISKRYGTGSAAGSGITHDPGAKVIISAGLAQLWTDINDRVDDHAHGGGSDGAQVDHGGLAGLTDDDHTNYSLADGSRAFTGEVAGITPTATASLSTKGYVDTEITTASDAITDGYPLGLRQVVTFTTSGTFTKASYSWLRAVKVRVVGGGGGGDSTAAAPGAGAGGGAGGFAEAFVAVGSLSTTETVTVGAGGAAGAAGSDTSFGTHAVGEGGAGAAADVAGAGGAATAGDLQIAGGDGHSGDDLRDTASGSGGASYFGGGGLGGWPSPSVRGGSAGRAYGAGGGGGTWSSGGSPSAGGAGADGIVIVELYA